MFTYPLQWSALCSSPFFCDLVFLDPFSDQRYSHHTHHPKVHLPLLQNNKLNMHEYFCVQQFCTFDFLFRYRFFIWKKLVLYLTMHTNGHRNTDTDRLTYTHTHTHTHYKHKDSSKYLCQQSWHFLCRWVGNCCQMILSGVVCLEWRYSSSSMISAVSRHTL